MLTTTQTGIPRDILSSVSHTIIYVYGNAPCWADSSLLVQTLLNVRSYTEGDATGCLFNQPCRTVPAAGLRQACQNQNRLRAKSVTQLSTFRRIAWRNINSPFFSAFAKLWNATISFAMLSVRLSARMEQLGRHWTDFHEIWLFLETLPRKFKCHYSLSKITVLYRQT